MVSRFFLGSSGYIPKISGLRVIFFITYSIVKIASYLEFGSNNIMRFVVKCLTLKGVTTGDIHRRTIVAYGEYVKRVQMFLRWQKIFLGGRFRHGYVVDLLNTTHG